MRQTLVIAALAFAWVAAASAQEPADGIEAAPPEAIAGDSGPAAPAPAAPNTTNPLVLTVRPSAVEETRAEKLARRARELDFAFRFICRGCSSVQDPSRAAPFNPSDVLAKRRRAGE